MCVLFVTLTYKLYHEKSIVACLYILNIYCINAAIICGICRNDSGESSLSEEGLVVILKFVGADYDILS